MHIVETLTVAHQTRASKLMMAAAMDHVIDGPPDTDAFTEAFEDVARTTITATSAPGKPLRLILSMRDGVQRVSQTGRRGGRGRAASGSDPSATWTDRKTSPQSPTC